MFLQILAVIAEFEANLIRQRTREGMDIARQHGKLRGKQPAQDREIRRKPGLQKTSATFQPITDIDRNPLHGRAARRASRSPGLSAGLCPCSCPGA